MPYARRVARVLSLGLGLALLGRGDVRGQFCSGANAEQEPNDTAVTGTLLQLDPNLSRGVYGTISTPGDVDYYRFQGTAGHRLWASVDTGRSSDVLPFSRDSVLEVYAPDGTTLLERDDDDGTGNAADYTVESQDASIVAGLTLPVTGTYVIRVSAKSPAAQISPYTLLLSLTSATSSEQEPNDTPEQANQFIFSAMNGTLSSASDVDYYIFNVLDAGFPMIMVDGDPERDGVGTDTVLEWVQPFQSNPPLLMQVDSSGALGSPAPPAEGAFVRQWPQLVRVKGPAAGTYRMSVVWSGYCSTPVVLDKLDVE